MRAPSVFSPVSAALQANLFHADHEWIYLRYIFGIFDEPDLRAVDILRF
jgi:hypothetical protein